MDTNKMREQFEVWHSGKYGWPLRNYAYYWNGTCYEDEEFQLAWDSWQASREAAVVELPKPDGSFENHEYLIDRELTVKAIEAQGLNVEVKP